METPLVLFANIDDEAEFYVNGELAGRGSYLSPRDHFSFQRIDGDAAPQALNAGKNVLAVHCYNSGGESRIDAGLYTATATEESEELVSRLAAAAPENPRVVELRSRLHAERGD